MNIPRIFLICSLLTSLVFCQDAVSDSEKRYCHAVIPCPVLNSPDFQKVFGGNSGKTVKVDRKGLIRELEFIAFPGTSFEVISEIPVSGQSILEVRTQDYPYNTPLFIDSRFVAFSGKKVPEREKTLPPAREILSAMKAMEGRPYMWGGNYHSGIKELPDFYPPRGQVPSAMLSLWRLEGVDCSGLIYQASGGYTPRNTSSMLTYGEGLAISGMTAEEISRMVEPLDLIVWIGHVVIVLSPDEVIESTHPEGVIISEMIPRLRSIMPDRKPANEWDGRGKSFVIRRWHR
ncbi:MAG: peptidoglycan endopeptidase [Candidatus Omnitrophota bacterium]